MSRHHHHQNHPHHPQQNSSPKNAFHRGWLFVVAIILMLIAMGVYMLTLDESVVPEPGEPGIGQSAP